MTDRDPLKYTSMRLPREPRRQSWVEAAQDHLGTELIDFDGRALSHTYAYAAGQYTTWLHARRGGTGCPYGLIVVPDDQQFVGMVRSPGPKVVLADGRRGFLLAIPGHGTDEALIPDWTPRYEYF